MLVAYVAKRTIHPVPFVENILAQSYYFYNQIDLRRQKMYYNKQKRVEESKRSFDERRMVIAMSVTIKKIGNQSG